MKSFILFIILAGAALVVSQSVFIVDQTQQAIVLQLGQPQGKPRGPGLHWKTPFIQNVRYFDGRILSVDPRPEQVVISSVSVPVKGEKTTPKSNDAENNSGSDGKEQEKQDNSKETTVGKKTSGPQIENISGEPIIVDSFARYKIIDPLQFMKTLRTVNNANARLESILNDSTRAILGETTLHQLLSKERTRVMNDIRTRVNDKITKDMLGIEIVDVRIVRADLTEDLLESTVKQMISQLKERATERRAKGKERALEIRSTAEKERTVILAQAERKAQMLRGQGDKEAIKIYAKAFNVDKDFYSFIRSMEAYRKTLATPDTRLILSPDSKFFRFFDNNK